MFERFAGTVLLAVLFCAALCAQESGEQTLQPSFPNYALTIQPQLAAGRASPSGPVDTEIPFSWTQTVVLREGATNVRQLGGFDPDLQFVRFELEPKEPEHVRVEFVDGQNGFMEVTALGNRGGNIEQFLFRVTARNVTNPEYFTVNYDIRDTNTRIRGTPLLRRSAGDFIKPGHIVRYAWTQTGFGEKRPKVEAEFTGRTGAAKGISSSTLTAVLAVKAQPVVLGHYLMTVTPRDVRGEPPRGSTSNGQVFRCAFGSENLPPFTDGMSSDSFTPVVGQTITLKPIAIDPETGQNEFSNTTWDFGDGTTASGITGAVTHAYSQRGIYRVTCTVTDEAGLSATAEDYIIVGATFITKLKFNYVKNIIPEEGGSGLTDEDSMEATFKGTAAKPGDRIIVLYNRNRFGRRNALDGEDADIVLKAGKGFEGKTALARNVEVTGGNNSVSISVRKAHFNRTADPRFGRADFRGVFKNQRIAVCVIPADGSEPRVLCYTGNVTLKLTAGPLDHTGFYPEDAVKGTATDKEPNPRRQEIF
ncbi:MAG TPA: PKD domain-containing protein [Planctomycetota bacterium]|nr:PKD domain-containing protein [Planctomycetota bacterium]